MSTFEWILLVILSILCEIAVFGTLLTAVKKKGMEKYLNKNDRINKTIDEFLNKHKWLIFGGILALSAIIRFWNFPEIPAGFNQDEAAIAYDSFSIMRSGMDRNGYAFPVYPVSWGAGQGPFYMYFAIPFMWLFGTNIFGFRIGNVLLSILSVACVYWALNKSVSRRAGLLGMLIIAISPWNIFLSRWALDANPLPSLFLIAFSILIYGIHTQKTKIYAFAAGLFAISLYTYGASYVVIPLFLLFVVPYLIYCKKMTLRQMFISGVVFSSISLPLFTFLLINYMHFDEIKTTFFSIPRLTVMRSNAIFKKFNNIGDDIRNGIKNFYELVIMQKPDGLPWNSVKEYGIIYLFSLPLIIFGGIYTIVSSKLKKFDYKYIYSAITAAVFVLVILINPNINRIHIAFCPLIFLVAIGSEYIMKYVRYSFYILLPVYFAGFLLFSGYYIYDYNKTIGPAFFESFDEAIVYANENFEGTIYVSSSVNGGYLLTLFHTNHDPDNFRSTVKYADNNAEFRHALSFGRYIFGIPDRKPKTSAFVVTNNEVGEYSENNFDIKPFKYYSVVLPK